MVFLGIYLFICCIQFQGVEENSEHSQPFYGSFTRIQEPQTRSSVESPVAWRIRGLYGCLFDSRSSRLVVTNSDLSTGHKP